MGGRQERRIAELAARQDGVVDLSDLREAGLSSRQVSTRLECGRLHPLHEGVYAVGHPNVSRRGRLRAALLAAGPQSYLCGRTGAAYRGLSVKPGPSVEVCVPPTGRRSNRLISVHATVLDPAERSTFNGLRVVSVSYLLFQLASVLPPDRLDVLMAEGSQRGMTARALAEQLQRARGRRGVRALRAAADGYVENDRTRSVPEVEFTMLCRRFGIEAPLVNFPLGDLEVDFHWPAARLIVEIDGFRPHGRRARFERDRERAVRLRLAGYEYLPFTPRQVRSRPGWVARSVTQADGDRINAAAHRDAEQSYAVGSSPRSRGSGAASGGTAAASG